ncbi:MAG: dual specificity protein phosphatase family protein [Thaumarchaeota archaeon]|nr:dual specificity protein phosphatase family protein [Nitrososphaerota archaeon]
MYCEDCVPIRELSRNKADNIIDQLYLGDMKIAGTFDGLRLCVHEHGPQYDGQCFLIPILTKRPFSKWDRTGATASIEKLDECAELIETHVNKGNKLLVHCFGGIERSPLTIAWWMVKTKRADNIEDAYKFLQSKRPAVSERLFWLPRDHEWFQEIP